MKVASCLAVALVMLAAHFLGAQESQDQRIREAADRLQSDPLLASRALQELLAIYQREPGARKAVLAALAARPNPLIVRENNPIILHALIDLDLRPSAIEVLASNTPTSQLLLPYLAMSLRDPEPRERLKAVYRLTRFGPDAARATRALVEALEDPEEEIRTTAAEVLAAIGPRAIEAVAERLTVRDDSARLRAVEALGRMGNDAVPYLLGPALKDANDEVRQKAREALAGLAPLADDIMAELLQALGHEDVDYRHRAARLLATFGPRAVPGLMEILNSRHVFQDRQKRSKKLAAFALGHIGPDAREAVPALFQALNDGDRDLRFRAIEALWQIGVSQPRDIPAFLAALRDPVPEVRLLAADCLARIGPAAVPSLLEVLQHPSPVVRATAAEALGNVRPPVHTAVAALKKRLDDSDAVVREKVFAALVKLELAFDDSTKVCKP